MGTGGGTIRGMGFFSRRDDDDTTATAVAVRPVEPPHPALRSLDALEAAPLPELAAAVLLAGFGDAVAGRSEYEFKVQQRIEAILAPSLGVEKPANVFRERNLWLLRDEAFQVLDRSCLVTVQNVGGNSGAHVMLTRRGRRALDSSDVAAWIDAPADPR
jgi:hypothetical protein